MYSSLLFFHSIFRWLVLLALVYAIYRAYTGRKNGRTFGKTDNALRHWTATISHIQLILGSTLYFISPVTKYFLSHTRDAMQIADIRFFGLIHMLMMFVAIMVITIGSALAKRKETDAGKFNAMLVWFTIGLILIFIAIPWPFSPLAARPYYRPF